MLFLKSLKAWKHILCLYALKELNYGTSAQIYLDGPIIQILTG